MQREQSENKQGETWRAPEKSATDSDVQFTVDAKYHREQVDREIAAAMSETPYIAEEDRRRRLNEIADEIIYAEDPARRHALAVERAALIQLGRQLSGEPGAQRAGLSLDEALNIPDLPEEMEKTRPTFAERVPYRPFGQLPPPKDIPQGGTVVRPGGKKAA